MSDNDQPIPSKTGGDTGWSVFDQVNDEFDEHREPDERDIIRRAYEATFKTKPGQAVLEDLMNKLKNVAAFDPDLGFYNGAAMGFTREGENRIIMYIQKMSEPPKPKG